MTVHHIVYDIWSHGVFLKELAILYKAFCMGKSSPLSKLPIQYADFAYWQKQWLQDDEVLKPQFSYWKKQLGGNLSIQKLPVDKPRPSSLTYEGNKQSIVLSKNLITALQVLSQCQGVTLFIILLVAFKILLYQYTGWKDIVVCSSFAGRNHPKIKDLIGYFNNIVFIRTDLSGNPSLGKLIDKVHQVVLETHRYQDLPLQKLTDFPNLIGAPLFQVMFILQNAPNQVLQLPEITASSLDIHNGTANFDLFLSIEEKSEELIVSLEYKTGLFNTNTIVKILEHFQSLLEIIVVNPEQSLSSVLSSTETSYSSIPFVSQFEQKHKESPTTPKDALELQLVKIWEKVLKVQPINLHDNFFDLGGHSLLAVALLNEVEKQLGKNLPLTALFQAPTIEQLANLMNQEEPIRNSSLAIIQAGEKRKPPLFFIQVLGKGLCLCQPLARYLNADQPVYGLSTEIMDREQAQLIKTGKERQAYYMKEIQILQPKGPYFLAGIYCGGRVAFEVAQLLHEQGQKVALLALIDTRVVMPRSAFKPNITHRQRFSAHWNKFLQVGFAYALGRSKKLFKKFTKRFIVAYQQIACKFYDHLGYPLPPRLQDFAIEEAARTTFTYLPQKYPGRITFFRAIDTKVFDDPLQGWHSVAEDGLEVHDIPGDTSSMLQEPYVQVLAKELKACMDKSSVLPNECR